MSIESTSLSPSVHANAMASNVTHQLKVPGEERPRTVDASRVLSPEQKPGREQLEAATKSVREFVKPINSNLEFSVDDDTGQLVVKVIDQTTREVIRQMPSEEMMAIAKALDNIKGLFVMQTA